MCGNDWQGRAGAAYESILRSRLREELLEKLVASAPPPPDWFEPQIPQRPERPNRHVLPESVQAVLYHWGDESRPEIGSVIRRPNCDSVVVTAWTIEEATRFREEFDRADSAIDDWREVRTQQTLAQWPWHYASLVLEAMPAEVSSLIGAGRPQAGDIVAAEDVVDPHAVPTTCHVPCAAYVGNELLNHPLPKRAVAPTPDDPHFLAALVAENGGKL